MNVLFDRETLKAVGLNRPALPFEVEIKDVDTQFSKTVFRPEKVEKKNENGESLYLFPQVEYQDEVVSRTIETTEKTDNPVYVKEYRQIPLLENGEQVKYEVIHYETIPAVVDEEGNVLEEEYVKETPTGIFRDCFITEEVEVPKTLNGLPLYYQEEVTVNKVPVESVLEITEADPLFEEGLEKAYEEIQRPEVVSFEDNMSEFTYEDVVKEKEKQVIQNTFFESAVLVEDMKEELFNTALASHSGSIGFNVLSLPASGEVRTNKIVLPKPASIIGFKVDSSDSVEVSIGDKVSTLAPVENGEVTLAVQAAEVYVQLKNRSDKRVDVHSFALLV